MIEAPCSPLVSDRQHCWCPRRFNKVMVMRSAEQVQHAVLRARERLPSDEWCGVRGVLFGGRSG